MPSIAGHDILQTARRANFNQPMYNVELAVLEAGSSTTEYPALSDLISIVAAVTPTASNVVKDLTIAAQPDAPRRFQVHQVDGSSNNTFHKVLLSGYDRHRDPISELIYFVGPGTQTITTVHAYQELVSAKSYFANSTTTGVTIGIGQADGLALPCDIRNTDDILGLWSEAQGAEGTLVPDPLFATAVEDLIDTRYGIYTPTTVPNGATKYFVSLRSTVGLKEF